MMIAKRSDIRVRKTLKLLLSWLLSMSDISAGKVVMESDIKLVKVLSNQVENIRTTINDFCCYISSINLKY
jgi:hypothetical protein